MAGEKPIESNEIDKIKAVIGREMPPDNRAFLIDHPPHYAVNPTGIECIQVTEHMNFNLGNAFKYIWRVMFGQKQGAKHTDDLKKAIWYLEREIARREKNDSFSRPDDITYNDFISDNMAGE